MTGEVVRLGGKHVEAGGYDLLGIINGSEGLLGVVTEGHGAHFAQAGDGAGRVIGFASSEDAGECVSKIIGAGIIPAAWR